ncbi:hypothetical protein [Chryseobacterium sp. Mn2064]
MKKKKFYILIAVITIVLLIMLFGEYTVTSEVGSWGWNRTINWGLPFGF